MKEILTKYGFVNKGKHAPYTCDKWVHPTGLYLCPDASTPTLTSPGVSIYLSPILREKLEIILRDILNLKPLSLPERYGWAAGDGHWIKGKYRIGSCGLLIDGSGNTISPVITVTTEKQFAAIEELIS